MNKYAIELTHEQKIEGLEYENAGLRELLIWMTGCGYDFTQHEHFVEQRGYLLKGGRAELKGEQETDIQAWERRWSMRTRPHDRRGK